MLNVAGLAALGGSLDINLLSGVTLTNGETFDILNYGTESGAFANAPTTGFSMDGWKWDINYDYAGQNKVVLTADSPISTPEPGSLILLGTGLASLLAYRRRIRL